MTLAERIARGEMAIAAARAEGKDTTTWEMHLAELRRQADAVLVDSTVLGELMTAEDRASIRFDTEPPRAWIAKEFRDGDGKLLAVKITSEPLDDHLYVVFDPTFVPPEPLVVYSVEEIEAMKDKTPEQVLEIHKVKIVFRGARVIQ